MKRLLITLSLLISILSSMAYSLQHHEGNNHSQKIDPQIKLQIPFSALVSGEHSCPQKNHDTHKSTPCDEHCNQHCHCGFIFLTTKIIFNTPEVYLEAHTPQLHPDPHSNGLYRPPIV